MTERTREQWLKESLRKQPGRERVATTEEMAESHDQNTVKKSVEQKPTIESGSMEVGSETMSQARKQVLQEEMEQAEFRKVKEKAEMEIALLALQEAKNRVAREKEEARKEQERKDEQLALERERVELEKKRANEEAEREKERVELEKKRANEEAEREKERVELEKKRANEEAQREKERVELEKKRANEEAEREKERVELEREKVELERERQRNQEDREREKLELKRGKHQAEMEAIDRKNKRGDRKDVAMSPMTDDCDVDEYLRHFESVATLCQWEKSAWACRLVAVLRGKAREAVLQMTPDDMAIYEEVKQTLLKYFRLDAHSYHKKFRDMKVRAEESFTQLLERLKACFRQWCTSANKDLNNATDVLDLFLQERIYEQLPGDVCQRVIETEPGSASEVANRATVIMDAKVTTKGILAERKERSGVKGKDNDTDKTKETTVTVAEQEVGSEDGNKKSDGKDRKTSYGRSGRDLECYTCGKKGHIARVCPERDKKGTRTDATGGVRRVKATVPEVEESSLRGPPVLCIQCAKKPYTPRCTVTVNGTAVKAIRDTGATHTVVARDLVSPNQYTGQTCVVTLAEKGAKHEVPIAEVEFDSPFIKGRMAVLVFCDPGVAVLVGNWAAKHWGDEPIKVPVYANSEYVMAVQTRAQAKIEQQEAKPLPVRLGIEDMTQQQLVLVESQQEDASLDAAWKAAEQEVEVRVGDGHASFRVGKRGVLERVYRSKHQETTQVVVPKHLRQQIMQLGHDAPMAGHMGVRRTKQRVARDFYWPGMCGDIARYVRSCPQCQKTVDKGQIPPVPVMRTPIPENPFDKVGVDIVGPIRPASSRGNRYVLVQVDHTTRYPDAVPLKNIDTVTVAEALWGLWCRTGVPKTVLTDRGTQFTSNMMGEVHRLLGIKGETTTPYHAQCNGVVERFNGTLKKMIRKLAMDKPTEWDRWIPAALFAYRETPQESTGFAPFELLYGRQTPGEEEENCTVAEYVVDLRNRIAQTCEIARQAVKKAAGTNKRYFDRKARQRTFDPDDRVYVLRPTKHNKLELTWQGPYQVVERLGEVDYKIQMPQGTTVWHANMLKKHVPCEETNQEEPAMQAIVLEPNPEGEECSVRSDDIPLIPLEATEGVDDVVIETEDPEFAEQLRVLVEEFDDVFTDLPTCTMLEECRINLWTDVPVRCKPYPVPFSQREVVEKEIDAMLKLGVIEPSTSSYASPTVLVKKKDGKVRFCVDYRTLNKVVEFDTEPIPDIDYLFAKLGDKVVLSKIDLARGYWQIPVAEEDRPKTVFVTHQGCYQWRVMPFGLCTSGAVFTRMMRRLILPLQTPDIDNFIDDVLVATETKEEHLQTLRKLFLRLRECHVSARPSKCELGCQEVEYLGHRTDVSETGVGAILLQVHDGEMHPVACASKKLLPAEKNYPIIEKECLALVWGVNKFARYLYGTEFVVQTDHSPLQHLERVKSAKVMDYSLFSLCLKHLLEVC
ncbi:uncharacterized protein LOC143298275 [Babylonia areolata]|uniref:uncharacterized protein LOC143298275 n=1 Tax=Babylonia areolata TaxID=304850 RepID=UPI003FD3732A